MYRVLSAFVLAVAFVFVCVLTPFGIAAGPANAGEYYDDGYYRKADNDWYTSHCCYRKIVRHERSVHYQRVDDEAPYYRHSYYVRPYYERSYYNRPYRSYYERPYRSYYDRSYRSGDYDQRPRQYVDYSYSSSNDTGYRYSDTSVYSRRAENCGRILLADGTGDWVWSRRAGCF
jgi:hypothetical protein